MYFRLIVFAKVGINSERTKLFMNKCIRPWLYSECIAKNIAVRAKAWREKNNNTI